eukprot:20932-Heterococcus_DN1.PRE.2
MPHNGKKASVLVLPLRTEQGCVLGPILPSALPLFAVGDTSDRVCSSWSKSASATRLMLFSGSECSALAVTGSSSSSGSSNQSTVLCSNDCSTANCSYSETHVTQSA